MVPLVFAALLCQQADINRPINERLEQEKTIEQARVLSEQRYIAVQRSEFAKRFDGLILALRAFEVEYRRSEGMVWPKKEADELNKAIRRLQSSEAWKQSGERKRTREVAMQ
jgi:hypothetical protein